MGVCVHVSVCVKVFLLWVVCLCVCLTGLAEHAGNTSEHEECGCFAWHSGYTEA